MLKRAKNQANAKQHPEVELLLPEKYSHSSSRYHPSIFKKEKNNKCVFIHEIIRLIIMKMKMKMKNRSHRYNIKRPRSIFKSIFAYIQNLLYLCLPQNPEKYYLVL